jgi:hypothetical protein
LYEDKKEIEYTSDGGGGERTGILPRQRLILKGVKATTSHNGQLHITFVLSIAAGTLTTSIPCRSHRRSHIQAAELVLLLITKISHLRFKIVIAERICRNRILANYSKLTVETSAKYKIFSDNRAR